METQKYYTPTIEEFCMGFKFEVKEKNGWISMEFWEGICPKSADRQWINDLISDNEVRVKCLDEQDVIELGWIKKKEEWYEIENKDKDAEITKYRLLFSLYELTENDYHTELFVDIKLGDIEIIVIPLGIRNIKNKSELKKIMQMLNIK